MHVETIFILLFVVATTVAIASRKLRVPYTVALVAAGLLLGALDVVEAPFLTKELLFALFLPGLLFEAAYHLEFEDFKRDLLPIVSLAVPGVVAAIALVALLLTPFVGGLDLEAGFTWEFGLVFGALIAATDPIAVVALFKTLGAPKRLGVLVEGESLLNDGTAVVLFGLALAFVTGEEVTGAGLFVDFVRSVGAGAAIGVVQDSIDIVDAASLTGEEPDPAAVTGVEELGIALEARASELGGGEAEMAERMAGLAEGLEADSVFGQLIIEGLLTGGEGFFEEG